MHPSGWSDLATALGLVLVIEGLVLALMPEALKRMAGQILSQPVRALRTGGLVAAAVGLGVVWLVRG
jgi:hypothetical protein